jgi:hypothetical protein
MQWRCTTEAGGGGWGETSPQTVRFWGGPSMSMDSRGSTSGQIYLRSGTQYWTMNVTMVVRAAPAEVVSLTPAFTSQCLTIGISSVTIAAASTPTLTFAVGAQLVGVFAGSGVLGPCGASPVAAITSSSFIEVYGNPEAVYHHQNTLQRAPRPIFLSLIGSERPDIHSGSEVLPWIYC